MAYKNVAKYRTIYVCKYGYKDVSGECERTYVYCIFSVTSEYSNKTQYNGNSEEIHIFYSTFRLLLSHHQELWKLLKILQVIYTGVI